MPWAAQALDGDGASPRCWVKTGSRSEGKTELIGARVNKPSFALLAPDR
jgi:hypothetical protein